MLMRSVFPRIDEDKRKPTTKQDILQEVEVLVRNGQRSLMHGKVKPYTPSKNGPT
jgi:hypothetical protein